MNVLHRLVGYVCSRVARLNLRIHDTSGIKHLYYVFFFRFDLSSLRR